MYAPLQKNISTISSGPKQPSISHSFMDNRPDHIVQTKCCNEIWNNSQIKLTNDFQTLSNPNRPGLLNHLITPIQRAPSDFSNDGVLDIPGSGKIFHNWRNLQHKINEYAVLQPSQLYERRKKIKEIEAAAQKWENANTNRTDPDRQIKREALTALESKLQHEIEEIQNDAMLGRLSRDSNQTAVEADDPLLTIPNPEKKDKEFFGFFKSGAQLYDKNRNPIDSQLSDHQCLLTRHAGPFYKVNELPRGIEPIAIPFKFPSGISEAFIEKDKVSITSVTKKRPNTHYSTAYLETPIFLHPPTPTDVEQNELGDCYLLAAMITLVKIDPDYIVNMMIDNLDGTVTVRLYDTSTFPFQPLFVRVKKTIAKKDNNNDAFAGGALWVSLLEKAYASAKFTGNLEESLLAQKSSFGIIAGGTSKIAMQHLLGRKSENRMISIPSAFTDYQTAYCDSLSTPDEKQDANLNIANILSECTRSVNWDKMSKTRLNHETLSTIFSELNITNNPNYPQWQSFINWLITNVPKKRGTGKYLQKEIDLFTLIATNIRNNKTVVLNTKEFSKSDKDGLNGEATLKGLAAPHAYAVLDCLPKDPSISTSPEQIYWLLLRNPWGNLIGRSQSSLDAGRVYMDGTTGNPLQVPYDTPVKTGEAYHKIKAQQTSNPEFWIELTDVTKRFSSFDTLE